MIHYVSGDIFSCDATAIVNTVNTEGIMGKGLALQFKRRYPENFKAYAKACKKGNVNIGSMFIFKTGKLIPEYIINFPTKQHWKNKSRMIDISMGLKDLAEKIQILNIKSIAIPPLGCGLGGLPWLSVKNEMIKTFSNFKNVDFYIYEPQVNYSSEKIPEHKPLTSIQTLFLNIFSKYIHYADSTNMTFVEAHKLCYLTQELGANLKLQFVPWKYGPYAKNLHFVFNDLENEWIKGYKDGKCKPFDSFHLLNKQYDESLFDFDDNIRSIINKLFITTEGFETALGLELLGTVHWIVKHENIKPSIDAVNKYLDHWCDSPEWSARKKRFLTPAMLQVALERLQSTGLI